MAPDNLSASGANNTITLTWNSVSGATSYTLYWDNVSGIDKAVGGYLATLNTKAENIWLYEKFGTYKSTARDLWIGALDNVTEGAWYWYNGTISGDGGVTDNISSGAKWPDGSNKWHTNEPNDWSDSNVDGQENCGSIRSSLSAAEWRWNDLPCASSSWELYGIFEID